MKTNELPERLEVNGSIANGVLLCLPGTIDDVAEVWTMEVAQELARRWNSHLLLSRCLDYVQHAPVCRGPGEACDCGLKELMHSIAACR